MILTAEDKPTKSIRVDHRPASWAPELLLRSHSKRRPAQPPVCGGRFASTSSGDRLSPFWRGAIPWLCLLLALLAISHMLQIAAQTIPVTAEPATAKIATVNPTDRPVLSVHSPAVFLPISGYDDATGAPVRTECADMRDLDPNVLVTMDIQDLRYLEDTLCPSHQNGISGR